MNIRPILAVAAALLLAVSSWAEIGIGDSREEVLRQTGKPSSIARRGDHEIFVYPKGARVEFVGGKVADVKGPLPMIAVAPPPTPPPATPEPKAAAAPEKNAAVVPTTPPATSPAKPPAPKASPVPAAATQDDNPAIAANELAKHVEKMDTPWGAAPVQPKLHSPLDSIPAFLTGLVLRFGITLLGLKLAFKYWEMDAFWKGIFAIAGIDLALHAILELLSTATHGLTTMGAVENGIPGLILIYTINRFCFNKRIQNAVVTAAMVKVVVTLCYVFVGLAALNAIYG